MFAITLSQSTVQSLYFSHLTEINNFYVMIIIGGLRLNVGVRNSMIHRQGWEIILSIIYRLESLLVGGSCAIHVTVSTRFLQAGV
jgi:hypothetical protein